MKCEIVDMLEKKEVQVPEDDSANTATRDAAASAAATKHYDTANTATIITGAHQHFTKHYDVKSGKFYHVIQATNEIIWDKPKGECLPLERNESLTILTAPHKKRSTTTEKMERQFIIEAKRKEYDQEKLKEESKLQDKRRNYEQKCWLKECSRGFDDNGKIQVDWKKFGYISDEIYNFETKNPTTKLLELSLNGNELHSIHDLPIHCTNLQRLSLACNQIRHLDHSVGKMDSLTHLNLLRNKLESLPESIGCLMQLQVLDVSHNSLTTVPQSIGNLKQIKVLNLECNKLEDLPNVFRGMNCEVMNLNSNNLINLPHSISQMKYLKRLSVCDNKLMFLPMHLCNSITITELHLSRNFIKELPNAIGKLISLECLWLDNNKLSALPSDFYLLKNLKELQLECNLEMINPSMEIIVKGPKEVLKWCELKLAKKNYTRKRNIITSMQDLLEQVDKLKLNGNNDEPHDAIFRSNVIHQGEMYYQFLMDQFWSSFLPKLEKYWSEAKDDELKCIVNSFPYERWEVEQTMFQFRDAAGVIIHYLKKAKFEQCCCADNEGRKRCTSIKDSNYKCERPAVLLRKNLTLETTMADMKRKELEEQRINEAIEAAKKSTKQHFNSEEGRDEIRAIAEDRIFERKNSTGEVKRQPNPASPSNKYKNAISLLLECLPHKRREEREIKEEIVQIQDEILTNEINLSRNRAMEVNRKLRMVLKAWVGLTTEDIFSEWRHIVVHLKVQREKDEKARQLENQRRELEEKEKESMALDELRQWERKWDNFRDLPFWQHALTNEITWDEPTIEDILNTSKWSFPPKKIETVYDADSISKKAHSSREKETLEAATRILERRRATILNKKQNNS